MADIIEPSSRLPGDSLKVKAGSMCDFHEDRPATHHVVCETDSFGSETEELCDDCYKDLQEAIQAEYELPQQCDWCKHVVPHCRPTRDMDEGMTGPVYTVCPACRKKQNHSPALNG